MRSILLGNETKKLMVRHLLQQKQKSNVSLRRKIKFGTDEIVVEDEIEFPSRHGFVELIRGARFSSIHMASYGYYARMSEGENQTAKHSVTGVSNFTQTYRITPRR